MLSFILVLAIVLIVWGAISLGKLAFKKLSSEDEPQNNQGDLIPDENSEENNNKGDDEEGQGEIIINPEENFQNEERAEIPKQDIDEKAEELGSKEESSKDASQLKTKPLSELKKDLGEWFLILANPDTPLPKDFITYTKEIVPGKQIDNRIIEPARRMLDDAKKDGIDLLICSAYRSVERQQELFDNSISVYMSQGYSREDAVKFTKYYYSIPGQSEHHTGLAMDIVTPTHQVLDDAYAETDAAKWLYDNAYKYGFILRYPKDKEDITKISFEPWHYRYVGVDHAKYIFKHKICFEEYLKLLRNA